MRTLQISEWSQISNAAGQEFQDRSLAALKLKRETSKQKQQDATGAMGMSAFLFSSIRT